MLSSLRRILANMSYVLSEYSYFLSDVILHSFSDGAERSYHDGHYFHFPHPLYLFFSIHLIQNLSQGTIMSTSL